MKKRNLEMKIRFTKNELDLLTKKARKAGLSRESYCRKILNDSVVKEAPPADVPMLIREINRVGISIDQLLKKANAFGFVDRLLLESELQKLDEVEKLIFDSYAIESA